MAVLIFASFLPFLYGCALSRLRFAFFMAACYCLRFRAIALTLRARLRFAGRQRLHIGDQVNDLLLGKLPFEQWHVRSEAGDSTRAGIHELAADVILVEQNSPAVGQ